ncbi:cytochrome P450 [Pseudobacteriovorax antillogorgiicola]|uniref:Cytochrome P450 n=1 Tax=Pseudobacteriovorax antillogorgiicola TaxID=1513793 RepID=A0A1Y6BMU2_9BACT|nr:cytochrome P450 [Pseudobacteriovorax antillogorgiicola]TCS55560.1 cytochrome P450 [Pseudobacteriovorax antillogorgiicola]SMF10975.1 Cytochrome P450 [Pseudobacteriovorax antillogorgiicola]
MDRISKLFLLGKRDSYDRLPGPIALPILGLAPQFRSYSVPYIVRLSRTYGDFVRFPMPSVRGVLVSDPNFIKMALAQTERNFYKGKLYERMKPFGGNGLVTAKGKPWRSHRKLANPAFTEKSLKTYEPLIHRATETCIGKINSHLGEEVDSTSMMMDLTFDVVAMSLFSEEIKDQGPQLAAWFREGQDYLGWAFWTPVEIPLWIPSPRNRRFNKAKEGLDTYIREMIQDRRQGPSKDDLLQKLIDANDDDNEGFAEAQIIDEVVTLMVAGHDTTALTLCYGLLLLANHPNVVKKLRLEIQQQCPDRPVSIQDLSNLKYLHYTLQEIMRLYPAVYMVNRTNHETVTYQNYEFKGGTTFFLSQYAVHRHPRYWKKPDSFIPERWQDPESIAPGSYFPFGGGPRTCIGNHLASFEASLALPEIIRRFDVQDSNKKFRFDPNATMTPTPGVKLTFSKI